MSRILILLLGISLACLTATAPTPAHAQSSKAAPAVAAPPPVGTWPMWSNDKAPDQFTSANFARGPGSYFGIPKLVCTILLFFGWILTCDWLNRDAQKVEQNYRLWNSLAFGPFAVMFLLQFVIPWYALSFVLMLAALVAPTVVYVMQRNKLQQAEDQVFTPAHLRLIAATSLRRFGIKISATGKQKGLNPPITLLARGAPSSEETQKREIALRQSPGQALMRDLIRQSIGHRASGIMLDFTAEAVAVKFLVDGVWLEGDALPRQVGDPVLAAVKVLCGLKPEDRRTRQTGTFTAVEDATRRKIACKLTSQGTPTGERALVQFEDPAVRKRRIAEYSLRQKVADDLLGLLGRKSGLFVIAAPPGGGLTSLVTACLASIDRYTRSIMAIEDKNSADVEVENVQITPYDSLEQESPMTKIPGVIRQFPDVLFVPELVNVETATFICEDAVSDDRLILTTARAREAAEGLLLPAIATKVPLKKYAAAVSGAIAQRLVRKLCDQCKEAYPPQPQILQKLGIPADKVAAFYRPPTQPRQEVCKGCAGLAYNGQIAMIELLVVDDLVRQTLLKDPKVESVRNAARKGGMKTFEDEGLLLVVKGLTSVAELSRVLKDGTATPAAAPAAAPAGPPAAAPAAATAKPATAAKPAAAAAQKPAAKPPAPKRPGS
ncbi:MAG: Flp pilus assembly complex ATPase component TadA [Planctomycetia bacterium]|nr:Flp pilus assembly complex ATPase component TadA [Planctomycetia bacterium]